ncbi:RNA-guided endonuclease InsQ/TnpB family protein [Kitasatospora cathayae]|uniref:RNA-guided endonuclease TnpB family protein n=1 Tax=Kitasatospora cathayae TaxID=3004092 RepID=A0ABY7QD49_9ACTN|nr:RNA-guided endonuclease TnpB family protein [Kitasatospora sp. HUAS 3-15]WBP90476.1 RNA-guided endonuclease TnpB family protein [Kitasatospora sp. HUAS 3-15]
MWNAALALRIPVKESNKLLGNARERIAEGPYLRIPKNGDLGKLLVIEGKRNGQPWLSQAPVGVLQQSLRDLDKAWTAHEDSKTGKRAGPLVEPPRFKSRKDRRQSARFTRSDRWSITEDGKLRLPKIGDLKVTWSRALPSEASSVTLIKDAAGHWFASFVVDTDPTDDLSAMPDTVAEIGIDLGLTHYAILSNGQKIKNPRWLRRAEKKIKRAQRELSRKQDTSKNRDKARVKVARAHAHAANARKDWQHKPSTKLISENQAITVETLGVLGLARSRNAKSVNDAGWGQFVLMLEYKAIRYGRELTKVARDFPSTRLCSACGHRPGKLPLHVRSWTCGNCQTHHDRDHNAAKNLHDEGRRLRAAARIPVDVPAPVG